MNLKMFSDASKDMKELGKGYQNCEKTQRSGNRKNDPNPFHARPPNRRSSSVSNHPKSKQKPSIPPKPRAPAKQKTDTHHHRDSDHSYSPPDPHTEEGRKKIANDTMKQITHNLRDPTLKYNVYRSETIHPKKYSKHFRLTETKNHNLCFLEVQNLSTYGAAKKLVNSDHLKTVVLNFASATKPGGGFLNGRNAQEESLSRQSSLYYSLTSCRSEMYKQPDDNYYTDYMIYSPRVHVFKEDVTESNLPKNEQFFVDVITSAAPNRAKIEKSKKKLTEDDKQRLNKLLTKRCRKIVICAIDKGNKALVLGAYGCGVFGNDPAEVSGIFRRILVEEEFGKYLKKVVFAIPGSKSSSNFTEFKRSFP